jgi:hypothetical protein
MNFKDTAFAFADESKINTTSMATTDSKKNGDTLSAALDSMDNNSRPDHPQKSPHSNKKRTPANLPNVKVPFDAPGGFLYEWWVIFWDVFAAKNNRSTNRDAIAYVDAQQVSQFLSTPPPDFLLEKKIWIAANKTKYYPAFKKATDDKYASATTALKITAARCSASVSGTGSIKYATNSPSCCFSLSYSAATAIGTWPTSREHRCSTRNHEQCR